MAPRIDETVQLPAVSRFEQTADLPIASLVHAMRHVRDQRSLMLRRIATFYIAIGCILLLSGVGIGMLEATGRDVIYLPTSPGRIAAHDTESVLPANWFVRRSGTSAVVGPSPQPSSSAIRTTDPTGAAETARVAPASTARDSATETVAPLVAQLLIPSIDIDAPVMVRGIDPDGVMQSPEEPWAVGWYDFSSHPLRRGNAVFAGHVDYIGIGPAVFWRLRELRDGDEILVMLADGTTLTYRVTAITAVAAMTDATTLQQIIGPTPTPAITIITCAGNFDPVTKRYDERLVVRAERIT